jgi:DNA-binding transcriptional regulator LsrR (DeoR family)
MNEDIKTRIAWLYYVEGMTQDEVASHVGLNRSRVLRILAAARQDGSVQIRVTTRMSRCVELERALESRWRLSRAIVTPEPKDQNGLRQIIGAEVGAYITQAVTANMSVGLGWGNTLSHAVPAIEPRPAEGIKVLSMLGGLTEGSAINPAALAWRVADRLSADCSMLAAPVYAPDPRTREALLDQPGLAEVLARARSLDMAVLSVGDLTAQSTLSEYGVLTRDEIASLGAAGAVGDLLCHFIDAEGSVIDHPVNRRVLAVHPRALLGTRQIVLASGGLHKLPVIRAALKLVRPTVLIVDETVAESLAAEPR